MGTKTENLLGSDASGASGGKNRIITLSNTGLTSNNAFLVVVNGLTLTVTSEYTVTHLDSSTTITFLNSLFNSQSVIVQYEQIALVTPGVYCTSANLFSFLQLASNSDPSFTGKTDFDEDTNPTKDEVDDWINESEDEIDRETMHAWRSVTVTKEQHHIKGPSYQIRDGSVIKLIHRNIKTLTSGTDLLEIWDGKEYVDYLATKTEGRNNDYWANEENGWVFIKTYPLYLPRTFGARVTYRYGETVVPGDIKRACVLLTAVQMLQSEDRSVLIPEGTSNISYNKKIEDWEKRAEKILSRNRELPLITT